MSDKQIGLKALYRKIVRSPFYCRFAPVRYYRTSFGLYAVELTMPDGEKRQVRTWAEWEALIIEVASGTS